MSLVATFTVPGAQFPLTRALPDDRLRVELDRVEPLDGAVVALHFWLYDADGSAPDFEKRLLAEAGVRDVTPLDSLDDRALFRAAYEAEPGSLFALLERANVEVLTAAGTADATRFVVRFRSESAVDVFLAATDEHDLPVGGVQTFSAASDFEDEDGFDLVGFLFDLEYFDPADPPTLDDVAASLAVSPEDVKDAFDRVKP